MNKFAWAACALILSAHAPAMAQTAVQTTSAPSLPTADRGLFTAQDLFGKSLGGARKSKVKSSRSAKYGDGAGNANNNIVDGGSGVWTATSTNWKRGRREGAEKSTMPITSRLATRS